jgi:hypothetical protein
MRADALEIALASLRSPPISAPLDGSTESKSELGKAQCLHVSEPIQAVSAACKIRS